LKSIIPLLHCSPYGESDPARANSSGVLLHAFPSAGVRHRGTGQGRISAMLLKIRSAAAGHNPIPPTKAALPTGVVTSKRKSLPKS
jgi:hypothetical protein